MGDIILKDVSKSYQIGEMAIQAVDRVSFTVHMGEFAVVVGPSGAGKTTVLNLLGGMAIGVARHGMSISEAAQTFSILTVGDGLVSQIPALLLSVSTGLIVTRATTESDMGSDLLGQFSRQRQAIQIAGVATLVLGVIPGLPKLPFIAVGALLLGLSLRAPKEGEPAQPDSVEEDLPATPQKDSPLAIAHTRTGTARTPAIQTSSRAQPSKVPNPTIRSRLSASPFCVLLAASIAAGLIL